MPSCDFCGKKATPLYEGFEKCKRCRLIFYRNAAPVSYEEDYFEKEYIAQYGRSYLADEANIRARMGQRLKKAFRYVSKSQISDVLEIGSAAGFFLEEARQMGLQPEGWEISQKMAEVANKKGLKTLPLDFFSAYAKHRKEGRGPFDMAAAFYVMEHFQNQHRLWEAFAALVKPNGLLLLAAPSWRGPAFYFQRRQWFQNHPADHFLDYCGAAFGRVAKRYGFQLIHLSPEGLHPERFPLGRYWPLRGLYKIAQQSLSFSDTLFAVLQKKGGPHNE